MAATAMAWAGLTLAPHWDPKSNGISSGAVTAMTTMSGDTTAYATPRALR